MNHTGSGPSDFAFAPLAGGAWRTVVSSRAVACGLAACLVAGFLLGGCGSTPKFGVPPASVAPMQRTLDDGDWFFLPPEDLVHGAQHTRHAEVFGKYIEGFNKYILQGIDVVQATAMDGGGYFIGVRAVPPESPVGYPIALFGHPLLDPPRPTSYCSGASYAAFIEGLNKLYSADAAHRLTPERMEAMRMQEPDGGRREDSIKYWGHWNDDGFGSQFALVQYSGMGEAIEPRQARPGDFMNISWTNRGGHAVVFLGWMRGDGDGQEPGLLYWSSQRATDGLGDQLVPLSRVRQVKVVRLTQPENLFAFDPETPVNRRIPGDRVSWDDE